MESLTKYFGPFVKKILEGNIPHNLSIFLSFLCSIWIYLKFGHVIISVLSFLMLLLILSIIIQTIYTYYIKKKEDKKFLESFTDLEKFTIDTFICADTTNIDSNELEKYLKKFKNSKYSTSDDFWNGLRSLKNRRKASYTARNPLISWYGDDTPTYDCSLSPDIFDFFRIKNLLNN